MRRTRASLDQLADGRWKPEPSDGDAPEVAPSATEDAGNAGN
jgi:hypothetical protein